MKLFTKAFFTVAPVMVLCVAQVCAQQGESIQNHAVVIGFENLSEDLDRGVITPREALIEKLRLTLDPGSATPHYLDDNGYVRCLTPLISEFHTHRDELDPGAVMAMDDRLNMNRNHEEMHISDSGKFILYYSRSGNHAVPLYDTNMSGVPDYIERAAAFADSSWNYMVNGLGFHDFIGPDRRYPIYFENIRSYGYTMPVGGGRTAIVVHSSFDGFPENHDPEGQRLGSLKVTIAHEIKHAIQYTINQWRGVSGYLNWLEMDATMMEDVVFGDVKDYYNYLGEMSVFRSPERSTPLAYSHATWMLFYAEHLGIDFWVDTWARVDRSRGDLLASIKEELEQRRLRFTDLNTRNLLWHFASGSYAPNLYGFNDKHEYPTPRLEEQIADVAYISHGHDYSLKILSANFFMLEPPAGRNGQVTIRIYSEGGTPGLGVLAYLKNGDVAEYIASDNGEGTLTVNTGNFWEDVSKIGIAVVNSSPLSGMGYTIEVETSELPLVAELDQNYPNPFNPSTTIQFTMPERGHASLVVYDVLGRRVAMLVDNRELGAGSHQIIFNASGMASGVYIYRLVTDSGVQARKMTLVR